MFARVLSFGLTGMESYPVSVEVDLSRGMPCFDLVGLPDAAVKEARDRVRSAVKNSGCEFPLGRIVANLAPAGVKKLGALYDLPLFVGLLGAGGAIPCPPEDWAFVGELSLSGATAPVHGVLPMALGARERGCKKLFVPAENAPEGAVAQGLEVYPVAHVTQLLDHLTGRVPISPASPGPFCPDGPDQALDFAEVKGQAFAKRALEVAAAGGHSVLMIGSPGSGKSMLAKRLPGILPPLTLEEAVETTKIHSIAGLLPAGSPLVTRRPFRHPHHTASAAALTGGTSQPRPGELSLAHNGVLFLDELPEFTRSAMEALRQPLEDGSVSISRASGTYRYPCSTMLVAAMNPCKCGYYGHPTRRCTCAPGAVAQYLGRISAPLLDRLDLHVDVAPVEFEHLASGPAEESSAHIQKRVAAARLLQEDRYRGSGVTCNARLTPAMVERFCAPSPAAQAVLRRAFDAMGLSARAYDRILKVARTIADLAGADQIRVEHVSEAVQYRSLDRKYWQR